MVSAGCLAPTDFEYWDSLGTQSETYLVRPGLMIYP